MKIRKKILVLVSFLLVLVSTSCELSQKEIDYSNSIYKCFIDEIIDAYNYANYETKIVALNDNYGIFEIQKNKYKRNFLFDLKNERVLSSDYKISEKKSNLSLLSYSKTDEAEFNYEYNTNGNLTNIYNSNFDFKFSYNNSGKIVEKCQNDSLIERKIYNDNKITKVSYCNDNEIKYDYLNGSVNSVYYNNKTMFEMIYDNNKNLINYLDVNSNRNYLYNYDKNNKLSEMNINDIFKFSYIYDSETFVNYELYGTKTSLKIDNNSFFSEGYEPIVKYDIADRPTVTSISLGKFSLDSSYEYNIYEPMENDLNEDNYNEYIYDITSDDRIKLINNGYYEIYYTYNDDNLIESYSLLDDKFDYYYDEKGQLISYIYNGARTNIFYDSNGNITKLGDKTYEYESNRQVLSNGYLNEYDQIGNPIIYNNKELSWMGRSLLGFEDTNFIYDKDGNRIQKCQNNSKTEYYYDNNKLIFEKSNQNIISYIYYNNSIMGLTINGEKYYFLKNGQNDVVGIIDNNGDLVVSYTYDPFGNIIKTEGSLKNTIGVINPIRYKSYYYDNETGLYYLNSRYYDPSCGRFISPDDTIYLMGTYLLNNISKNLYVYCLNDFVNRIDELGTSSRVMLNIAKFLFADVNFINEKYLGATMLILNGGNIYNAFHETAQILASKKLQSKGLNCALEVPCKKYNGNGEIDILANNKYVYEVKNYFDSLTKAQNQVYEYADCNGYTVGEVGFDEKKVEFLGNKIFIRVEYKGKGAIMYSFSKEYSFKVLWKNVLVKKEITEEKLSKALKIATWAGIAVAGGIVIATLVEDFVTCGAGVSDDLYSLEIAARTYNSTVTYGVLAFI